MLKISAPFRPMRLSDKARVVDICSTIFDGNDYMPREFEGMVSDPATNKFFGLEDDGILVGLINLRMLDEGLTAWVEGLRVDPAMRGRKFGQKLLDESIRMGLEDLGCKRVRYSVATSSTASMHMGLQAGMKPQETTGYFRTWKVDEARQILRSIPKTADSTLTAVNSARLYELLAAVTESERRAILPVDVIHLDWTYYDVLPEIAEKLKDAEILVDVDEHGKLRAFSLAVVAANSVFGSCWSASIFSQDPALFLGLMEAHVELCLSKGLKDFQAFIPTVFTEWIEQRGLGALALEMYVGVAVVLLEK